MSRVIERVRVPIDRRKAVRRQTSETGSAISLEGCRSIIVKDVSENGVKVCGHHLPAIGRQVLILVDGLEVFGSVVWARFRQRGIAADEAIIGRELVS